MAIPDNYDLFLRNLREQEEHEKRLPKCSECGEPIGDDFFYKINGQIICESCMDECKVSLEEYIYERV